MLNDDFVENFISNCIKQGKSKHNDICEEALLQMKQIDEKLRESNQLRITQKNLKKVLKELGHDSIKKTKSNEIAIINTNVDKIEDSIYLKSMIDICGFVNKCDEGVKITSREIINTVGSMDNDKEIYISIKNLYDYGILDRDEERNVIKGPNWDKRPI